MEHTRLGYWIEEAGEVAPAPPLAGDFEADVVVVGGGFTGLWTAWYLRQLEPSARIAVLESERLCGRGPSGRNGGFCNPMWYSAATMRARFGDEAAVAIGMAAEAAVERIGAFCADEEVDAWWNRGGFMQVSTAPAHDGEWEPALAACRELGHPEAMAELTPGEVRARCDSPAFRGGAVSPGATVQPARLALGIRRRLREEGVSIFESSAVRSLRSEPGRVVARTEGGAVRAERAVLAIGGALKGRRAPLRGRLTVSSSHIVITEPVPELIEEVGWTGGEAIIDSRALVDYFRTTPDGRIAFGWGGGRIAFGARTRGRAEVDPAVAAATANHLFDYFPALRGRRLTHAWGGPIDVSPTHLPSVTTLDGGRAFAAAGYTGNGVGPTNMVARTLASLALDRNDPPAHLAFVDTKTPRVPPDPFHWLGGEVIRKGIEAKEEAELAGRPPSKLSRAVAGVPKLIGFHIGR